VIICGLAATSDESGVPVQFKESPDIVQLMKEGSGRMLATV